MLFECLLVSGYLRRYGHKYSMNSSTVFTVTRCVILFIDNRPHDVPTPHSLPLDRHEEQSGAAVFRATTCRRYTYCISQGQVSSA